MKRRVALIGTGGTISSIGRDSLDLWEYMDTSRKAEPHELLSRFPETAEAAEIVPVRFRAVGSAAIGTADWLALAQVDRLLDYAYLDGRDAMGCDYADYRAFLSVSGFRELTRTARGWTRSIGPSVSGTAQSG